MNSRFLPMGIALAPSLPGGALKRAAQGQPVVDASWAMAAEGDGTFDRWFLFGVDGVQYVTWSRGRSPARSAATCSATRTGSASTRSSRRSSSRCCSPSCAIAARAASAALGALIALALVPIAPRGRAGAGGERSPRCWALRRRRMSAGDAGR